MTTSHQSRQSNTGDPATVVWERRRNAAWIDYLRSTREAPRWEYEQHERNAWEQLQRRLRRNDELLYTR